LRIFAYENAKHSPHCLQKNSPYQIRSEKKKSQEITIPGEKLNNFKQMLQDILSIAKGNLNAEIKDLKVFAKNSNINELSRLLKLLCFDNSAIKPKLNLLKRIAAKKF
jgi:hypothetical protein